LSFQRASNGAAPARRIVRLHELRRFLECPLQGGAALSLGLRTLTDETEIRETTDEPFDPPRGLTRGFLADLFVRAWTDQGVPTLDALGAAYDRAIAGPRLSRGLPAGLFGAAVRRQHLELLALWQQALAGDPAAYRGPAAEPSLGRPEPACQRAQPRPALLLPVTLGGTTITVELRGGLAPRVQIGEQPGALASLIVGPESRSDSEDRDCLRLFLDHLALSASDPTAAADDFRGILCREQANGPTSVSFVPVSSERASAYLADLTADALAGNHDYFLPHEAVFMARKKQEKNESQDLVDCIVQMRDDTYYRGVITSNYGPVPQPLSYPVPTLEAATAMAQRRFGLFFELRRELKRAARKKA
jgi:exodeoxyribonuclease V gamma subunit